MVKLTRHIWSLDEPWQWEYHKQDGTHVTAERKYCRGNGEWWLVRGMRSNPTLSDEYDTLRDLREDLTEDEGSKI